MPAEAIDVTWSCRVSGAGRGIWEQLFTSGNGGEYTLTLYELRRRGEVFLALPSRRRAALATLELYPAQTVAARCYRRVLKGWIECGLPLPMRKRQVHLSREGFVELLKSAGAAFGESAAPIGILTSNCALGGRRFVMVTFDAHGRPVSVVKVGTGSRARALVAGEREVLARIGGAAGVPAVRGSFSSDNLDAFAADHLAGSPPRGIDPWKLGQVLGAWLCGQRELSFADFPQVRRLDAMENMPAVWQHVRERLAEKRLCPAIGHGDFAPWNVKVGADGAWRMMDWEYGEPEAVPCWDWFHYLVQTWALVKGYGARRIMAEIETVMACEPFQAYSRRAGAAGVERELFAAYLCHAIFIFQRGGGAKVLHEALEQAGRWASAR